jgi:hypothetical protein
MRGKDTLLTLASKPKATRVLLALAFVALFTLAADPAAAVPSCEGPDIKDELCR